MGNNKADFYVAVDTEQRMRNPLRAASFTIQSINAQLENSKLQVDEAITQCFQAVADKAPAAIRFLALPRLLANHHILGTNVAMNVLYPAGGERMEEVDYVLEEIALLEQSVPSMRDVANVLAHEHKGLITLAECFWLLKLSQWFFCVTTEFTNRMESALFVPSLGSNYVSPDPAPPALRNIEYHAAPTPQRRPTFVLGQQRAKVFDFMRPLDADIWSDKELLPAAYRQYEKLEEMLRKL